MRGSTHVLIIKSRPEFPYKWQLLLLVNFTAPNIGKYRLKCLLSIYHQTRRQVDSGGSSLERQHPAFGRVLATRPATFQVTMLIDVHIYAFFVLQRIHRARVWLF